MKDILQIIAENKKREVEAFFRDRKALSNVCKRDFSELPVFSMSESIRNSKSGIIAEFKRRSPSKGEISPMADVALILPEYVSNGAAACSVLTDTRFFGGAITDLTLARTLAKTTPLLRKDFIVSKYQIDEARESGASAILLIAAILTKEELEDFNNHAHFKGMESLIEIHDINELDKINFNPDMLGVNNRNLSSFHTDVAHSLDVVKYLPENCLLIAESGIKTPEDLQKLKDCGFSGFLIGEALMSTPEPGTTLKKFVDAIN